MVADIEAEMMGAGGKPLTKEVFMSHFRYIFAMG